MSRSRTVETIELLTATAIKNIVIILYNAVKTATPHQSPAVTASPQGEALRKITIIPINYNLFFTYFIY